MSPWIINMQKYGPPPSYPNYKLPGFDQGYVTLNNMSIKKIQDHQYYVDKNYLWGQLEEQEEEKSAQEDDE